MKMSFDPFEDECFLVNRDILFSGEDTHLCKDGDIVRLRHGKNSGKLARITLDQTGHFLLAGVDFVEIPYRGMEVDWLESTQA